MTMNNHTWENELDSLQDEYEDALFRIAMLEMEMEKTERLMADIETGTTNIDMASIDQEAEQSRKKIYGLIDRQLRRARVKHFVRETFPRACIIAVCVIGVLSIGAVTTFAASKTVRMKIFELLVNIQQEYTELSLIERQGSDLEVPADWAGAYYPSYIPEGFSLLEIEGYPGWSEVYYQNKEGFILIFSEYENSAYTNLNTEDAELTQIEIHGNQALCADNGDTTYIAWSENNRYFVVTLEGTSETAQEIAKSVIRIN